MLGSPRIHHCAVMPCRSTASMCPDYQTQILSICTSSPSSSSSSSSSSRLSLQLGFSNGKRFRTSRSGFVSCRASKDGFDDTDYVEAFLLVSETVRHNRLRKQGFLEQANWKSNQVAPYSSRRKDPKADVRSIGMGFLQHFQSPTIFLKIVCDGDLLLPIIVGEFAIGKLVDALTEDENSESRDQYPFLIKLTEKLGYEIKMVRITERKVNTYYARIYFMKPGDDAVFSVDARPSDAINVACRCKVPIFVNKEIVLTDAIRIVYGTRRGNHSKSVYDVSLDSAEEGPDELAHELTLVKNMNIAVKEERYKDAAMWRDKLNKLRTSKQEI